MRCAGEHLVLILIHSPLGDQSTERGFNQCLVVLVAPAVPYPGGGPGGGGGSAAAGRFSEESALRGIVCASVVRLWQEHVQSRVTMPEPNSHTDTREAIGRATRRPASASAYILLILYFKAIMRGRQGAKRRRGLSGLPLRWVRTGSQ